MGAQQVLLSFRRLPVVPVPSAAVAAMLLSEGTGGRHMGRSEGQRQEWRRHHLRCSAGCIPAQAAASPVPRRPAVLQARLLQKLCLRRPPTWCVCLTCCR